MALWHPLSTARSHSSSRSSHPRSTAPQVLCPCIIAAWVLFLQVLAWLCAYWGPLESFPDFISLTSVAGGFHTARSVLYFIVCPHSYGYYDLIEHGSLGTQRGPSESWLCSLHRPWKARPGHRQTCVLVSRVVFTVFPHLSTPFPLWELPSWSRLFCNVKIVTQTLTLGGLSQPQLRWHPELNNLPLGYSRMSSSTLVPT